MKLLKIFSLFLVLYSLFAFLASSPSYAQMQPSISSAQNPHQFRYPCRAASDCSSYKNWIFNQCVCEPSEIDSNNYCQGANQEYLGHCTGTSCTNDSNCGGSPNKCVDNPDTGTKICQYAGEENLAVASPWFIENPERYGQAIEEAIQNNTGEIDSRLALTSWITTIESHLGYTIGGTTQIADAGGNIKNTAGVTGTIAGLVFDMTTKPTVSSKEYLADLGRNLGITPVSKAYAQGIGFNAFLPALDLWKVFRNVAYLAFIAIFIVVGLMVMFRQKIDPRTVVTIQEALPKIIVSLVLITFSYAIAGFIVDVGVFSTRLVGKLFEANGLIAFVHNNNSQYTADQLLEKLFNDHIFTLVNPLRSESKLINYLSHDPNSPILEGPLTYVTLKFIFVIINFYIMFKIFFSLLGPYVSIILSVIFAPINLLLGALPGPNNNVTNWLKGLISNVAVFPVVFTLLAIAAVFKGNDLNLANCTNPNTGIIFNSTAIWCTDPSKAPSSFLSIPAIGNWGPVVGDLIAFGILFAIPNVTKMIQDALGQKPSAVTSAFPQEFAAGAQRVPLVGGLLKNVYGGGGQ